MIDKSTNTAIYEPGTYNARGQMLHYAMNNKSLYTTLGYNDFGLPTYRMTGNFYPTANGIQNLETNFNNQTGNLNWRKDHSRSLTENFTYDAVHKNRLATWQVQGQQQYGITYNHANGNIITKTDFTSPGNPYTYGLNAGPHAVTGVNAPLLMPAEAQQEISYNSFNKASYINHNYQRRELLLHYGPDEQRIKTEYKINGQTTLTRYFPGGGLEVEVDANGQERWLHYLPGGGLYVCDKNFNKIGMYYVLTDYLGSWHKVISETGTTIEEYSFDPWGRRRNPANWTYTGVPASFTFNRGYTGHEMLDAFNLINMNGRMYDPVMGRMLSPDNYVSSASSTQAFNRYSYALNNPLIITDPSGDTPVLLFVAFSAVLSGAMSAQNGDGFVQGFATGAITGGISYGVGAAIGPLVSGSTVWASMANAGIHTAISGTLTYGMDALINDSPFNWKGYGMNIAASMAMAALSYQKPTPQYNESSNMLADLQAAGIQTELGSWYGMSYGDPPGGTWGTNEKGAVLNLPVVEIVARNNWYISSGYTRFLLSLISNVHQPDAVSITGGVKIITGVGGADVEGGYIWMLNGPQIGSGAPMADLGMANVGIPSVSAGVTFTEYYYLGDNYNDFDFNSIRDTRVSLNVSYGEGFSFGRGVSLGGIDKGSTGLVIAKTYSYSFGASVFPISVDINAGKTIIF